MSINSAADLVGLQKVGEAVGTVLRQMRAYAAPGMSTYELDAYGGSLLAAWGAGPRPASPTTSPGGRASA